MKIRSSGFMRQWRLTVVVIAIAFVLVGARRADATGPGVAADFVVLSDGFTSINSSRLNGEVGGGNIQTTDHARINGDAIASASSGVGLNFGDNTRVTKKCVTAGGSIDIVPAHPARCIRGEDTSGNDPLLTELTTGVSDALTFAAALSAMTPTDSVGPIDVAPGTRQIMRFPAGTSVVATSSMLIENNSKLTIRAPRDASVIFQVGGLLTTQLHGKIVLAGGIQADHLAFVVGADVTLGQHSSVMGTVLAPSGNCTLDDGSRLKGALFCDSSVTFGFPVIVTFAPLPTTFP